MVVLRFDGLLAACRSLHLNHSTVALVPNLPLSISPSSLSISMKKSRNDADITDV